jgi:hypothetical protein
MANLWDDLEKQLLNPEKPNAPGVWSDIKRTGGQFVSGVGSTLRDVGAESIGEGIEKYGTGVALRNPSQIKDFNDILESPFTTLREAVSEVVPQVGLAVGGQLAGRAVGGALGIPFGPLGVIAGQQVGGVVGGLLPIAAQTYGGIRSEQRAQGIEDIPRAIGATIPSVVLERLGGAERIAGKIAGQGTDFLAREAGQKFLPHVGKQLARGGLEETITEVPQTALERYGAYKPLTGDEATGEYAVSGVKAFLGGGAIRGGLSAVAGTRGLTPEGETDLTAPPVEAPRPEAPTLGPTYSPLAGTPIVFPDGSVALNSEQEMQARYGVRPEGAPQDLTAPATEAAKPARLGVFDERDTALLGFGVKPSKKTRELYDTMVAAELDMESDDAQSVLTALANNKLGDARRLLAGAVIAKNKPQQAPAPAAQPTQTVTNVAQAPQAVQAEAQGQAPTAPVAAAPAAVDPQMASAWDDHRDEGTPSFDQLPANMQQTWSEAVAAKQQNPKVNLYKIAEELTAEGVSTKEDPRRALLNQIFGGRDGEIIFDVVGEGMSQQAAADKYGMSRAAVEKIVGSGVDATNRRNARIQRAMESGVTKEQIVEALKPTAGVTDENSLAIRNMFSGISVDPLMAQEAGMEGIIGTVGGSEANTGAKLNDVEKKLFALLEQRATTSDEATLAEIDSELAKITDLYKDLEAKEQAKVREMAGKKSEKAAAEEDAAKAEQPAELGAEDAIQVESPTEVPVRQGAEAGQRVGKQVRRAEKPAGEGQAQGEVGQPNVGEIKVAVFRGAGDSTAPMQWYSTNREVAEKFAEEAGAGGKVAASEVTLKNPLVVDVKGGSWAQIPFEGDTRVSDSLAELARQRGHDGLVLKNVDESDGRFETPVSDVYVVFNNPETTTQGESEQAAKAWDKVAAAYPTAPKFADLTKDQQETFTEYGPDNWTKDDVERELGKLAKSGAKFGKTADNVRVVKAKNPYTAKALLADIKDFIRADIPGRKLMVVDSVEDLLRSSDKAVRAIGAALAIEGAYGVAANGKAYLIADRIEVGAGRAKFMHEVGAHLGLENLLPKAVYDRLTDQLMEWAKKDDGSIESELVLNAIERVQSAGTPKEDRRAEMLAYFIEEAMEAGIDPTAATKEAGPLNSWFRTLWAAFKVAVRKLGFKPESLNAQDVVNLAFGAARLEINGTWHGTAAAFRKFNNKFIGSGEGATAYGWGTYLAQRIGIAKGYWSADVQRKSNVSAPSDLTYQELELFNKLRNDGFRGTTDWWALNEAGLPDDYSDKERSVFPGLYDKVRAAGKIATPEGSLKRVDTAVADDRVLDYDKPVIKQSEYIADKLMALLDPHADDIVDRTNKDVEELTGRDLIGSGENDLGLLSQLIMDDYISPAKPDAQFDRAVQQGKFHEAASHLLRTLGIDGIKFLDAKSRGTATEAINYDGRTYNRDDLRDQVRKYRETDPDKAMVFNLLRDILRNGMEETKAALEAKVAEYEQSAFATAMQSAARYNAPLTQDQARADAKEYVQKYVYQAKQLAWLNDNAKAVTIAQLPKTRNLIVFDDKNIFRVGSEVAADRQRMKFGKAGAAPQGLINRNINKLPQQLRQPAKNVAMYLNDAMGRGLDYLVFTGDLVGRAVAAGMPAANRFATALANSKAAASERERRIEKIADMYATIEEANKGKGPGTVNDFLFESTRTGKWGYGKYRDDAMGAAFDALGPKAQAFVKAVFAHGDSVLSEKKRIVTDAATSEYDAMIAIARKDGDKAAESKLLAEKVATLDRFKTLFKVREGLPYAPIKRSGAWAVVSKSPEYEEAVAAGDTKRVRELEKNPEHYQVSFVDTKWDASNLQAEIDAAFPGMQTGVIKRAEALDDYSGQSLLPALTNLRAKVDADKGTQHTAMLNLVSQLYLEALAEDSARKSEMRRRGISGDVDMLSSFATQGRADANFMSSIEYSPEIQDALQQMRTQSKTGGTRKTEIFDELSKRYVGSLDYDVNSWVSKLTNLSSKYFLATSPGYYLQNLTQPFMLSVPAMAGRHDYTAAGQALWKAYSELGPLFKNTKLFDQQFDFSQVPNDVLDVVDELVKRGKIDIGLATEINEYKVDADGKLGNFAQKLNKGMRMAVQKTEAINRLSTAMAAYRLELKRTGSESKALEYADRILTETHGDYTAFNAPRIFNSNFGKVALQFRKFQLVQIAFYAKLIRDAFTNPAERKAAFRTIGYSLAHSGVFAGALGLPGYAAVAAITGFLGGDEDEPYDLTEDMRKALGPEWSQLIMRGAPTLIGADLSGKIGSGQMLSVAPFTNIDLTKQASTKELIGTILGGASGGMTARMLDGLGQMINGDVYRGLEMTLPKGVGDMLKAGRIAGEGLTRRNGDVLLPKEDVSAVQALWSAMGIPAPSIAETYQRKQYATDLEQSMQERSTKLKNQYAKAYRAGDSETMAKTREQWKSLQEARKRNEMKAQPLSTLLKAPQEQLKREKKIATQLD